MSGNPGEQLSEEPQSERAEPASRDSGSDEPGGDRPEGSIDDEAVPSYSDTDESVVGELRRHRDPSADDS